MMGKELKTFLNYPPMQRGASFNLDAVKAEMAKKMEQAQAAAKGTGQYQKRPLRRAARKAPRPFSITSYPRQPRSPGTLPTKSRTKNHYTHKTHPNLTQ